MTVRGFLVGLGVCVAVAGCGAATNIRTNPAGAKVWLAGEYVGESPVRKDFTNAEWSAVLQANNNTLPYKLTLDGYETQEGRLPIRVRPCGFG